MSDYEDYDNLAFPPQDESLEQKLAHSEKMRDYTAEYVAKLEEKLIVATNAIEQVLKEPNLMDAGMLMYLTFQLNKIKE